LISARNGDQNYIAGWRTATDWHALRPSLDRDDLDAWKGAYRDFFVERLKRRYLDPIAVLKESGTLIGEGFSIMAIQCSLIEFLEAMRLGKTYRRPTKAQPLGPYEYSTSGDVFAAFLFKREPFSRTFNAETAEDFYLDVRCGLVHEARTKGGWRIWADGPDDVVADIAAKKVFRNNFQAALLEYIKTFEAQLLASRELRDAFVRKFDSLCV
jgi:hypothetical protein